MAKSKSLWIAFTSDELELPIAVADTAKELGKYLGITENGVFKNKHQKSTGEISGYKVERIDIGVDWRDKHGL
mgnify:CR=1 FL=1